MSDHHHLPPELVLEVFKCLQKPALMVAATTSRTFCALARPLLFSDIEFVPYHYGTDAAPAHRVIYVDATLTQLTGTAAADFLAKLDFCTSPDIAPLVRCLSINAVSSTQHPLLATNVYFSVPFVGRDVHDIVLRHILPRLHRRTGISRLDGHPGLDLTLVGITMHDRLAIANLPLQPRSLRLSTVQLFNESEGARYWLALLDPDVLHRLEIDDFRLEAADSIPIFPKVVDLRLDVSACAYITAAVPKFPNVERATLNSAVRVNMGPLVMPKRPPFPRLTEFVGKLTFLAAFVPGTSTVHLQTTFPPTSPTEVMQAFGTDGPPASLRSWSLVVVFDGADDRAALATLLAQCPNLEALDLHLQTIVTPWWNVLPDIFAFISSLPSIVSPSLRAIKLFCTMVTMPGDDFQLPEAGHYPLFNTTALRDQLLRSCPNMDRIEFRTNTFYLFWKALGGGDAETQSESWDLLDRQEFIRQMPVF
ncbi:hypothetical protein MKEN_00463000 [Mycena kentingensis (nom. inval.)]|nr:hypothetical protein MKEN_00463000 [Mycena kentingensis (nom. inval.)]